MGSALYLPFWSIALLLAMTAGSGRLCAVDSFDWEFAASQIQAGRPFPVTISAKTQGRFDPTADVELDLNVAVLKPQPTVVISQILNGQTIELINASVRPVQFSGKVLVHGGSSNPSQLYDQFSFTGTGVNAPVSLESGERLLFTRTAPAGYQGKVYLVDVRTFPSAFGAVFVTDHSGPLDAWVGTNYLAFGGVIPPDSLGLPIWSGPGVPVSFELPYFGRLGRLRRGSAADWMSARTAPSTPLAMQLPLDAVPELTPANPPRVRLVSGRWSGLVTVAVSAAQAVLHGDDQRGASGQSQVFTIANGQPLSLRWPEGADLHEGGAPVMATVAISDPLVVDLPVNLLSSDEQEIQLPREVVIPAGQITADFPVSSVADGRIDGPQAISVRAVAPGFVSSAPLLVTNQDSTVIEASLVIPDAVDAEPKDGWVQIPLQIRLSQAIERNLEVNFRVSCLSHPALADVEDWFSIPALTLLPGRDRVSTLKTLSEYALGFPARFRVVAMIPGWPPTEAVVSIRPRSMAPVPKFVELNPAAIYEAFPAIHSAGGRGWVSNWISVEIPLRRDADVRIDLSSNRPDLITPVESVVIRAFQTNAIVPVQVNYLPQPAGTRVAVLSGAAFDGSRGTASFSVPDERIDSATIEVGDRTATTFYEGLNTNVTLRLRTSLGTPNPSSAASVFSGALPVSFDFQGLPVFYIGDPVAVFSNGVASLSMGFSGLSRSVEVLLTRPDGSILRGPSVNITKTRTQVLSPVDLLISLAGPPSVELGGNGKVSVLVTNASANLAERVALLFDSSLGLALSKGRSNAVYALRPLAGGDSAIVEVPFDLAGALGSLHRIRFTVNSDNRDLRPLDNILNVELPTEPAPPTSGVETGFPLLDLTYSPETGKFYGSLVDRSPRLVEINPDTAAMEREFELPGVPGLLQASGMGRRLYAFLNGGTNLVGIDLITGVIQGVTILDPPGQDLAIVPGTSNRVVVTGIDSHARVYLDGSSGASSTPLIRWVEPDLDGSGLVGLGDAVWVSSDGGTWSPPSAGASIADLALVPARPDAGWRGWRDQLLSVSLGAGDQFPGYLTEYTPILSSDLTVDSLSGNLYYLSQALGVSALIGLSPSNSLVKRVHFLEGIGSGTRLQRFGSRGIAFRNTRGRTVFLQSPVVESGEATDVQLQLNLEPGSSSLGRYRIIVAVTNAGPSVASNATVLLRPHSGDLLFEADSTPISLKGGAHLISLGDVGVGERVVRSFEGTVPNEKVPLGLVRAEVYGHWREWMAGDNLQLKVRRWDWQSSPRVSNQSGAAKDSKRGELFCPFGFSGLANDPFGVMVLDLKTGIPLRFLPTTEMVQQLVLSEDGSILHLLPQSGRSLLQLDPRSGIQMRQTRVVGPEFILGLVSPNGLPAEDVIALRAEITSGQLPRNRSLVWFQAGRPAASLPAEITHLIPGVGVGEMFGVLAGTGTPLQRWRARDGQLESLGLAGGVNSGLSNLVRVGERLIADSGEVYSATQGAYETKLWDNLGSVSLLPHPTLPVLLSASADFPNDPQTHLRLWDLGNRRVVSERHVPQSVSTFAKFASLFDGDVFYLAPDLTPQSLRWTSDPVPSVGLGWSVNRDRLASGEFCICSVVVTNLNAGALDDCSLTLNIHPLVLERIDSAFSAEWVRDAQPLTHIDLGTIPPLATQRYDLVIRGSRPALVPLEISFRSATFHQRVDSSVSSFLLIEGPNLPSAAVELDLGLSPGISAWAGLPGQDELWVAHRGLQNALLKLQLTKEGPRVLQSIPVSFSPETVAVNADGTMLYAAPKFGAIYRFDLRPGASSIPMELGDSQGYGYEISALACPPTDPDLSIASLRTSGSWRVGLFRQGQIQPSQLTLSSNSVSQLAFWGSDRFLAAVPGETSANFYYLKTSESGIVLDRPLPRVAFLSSFTYAGGSLYFANGMAMDAATGGSRVAFSPPPLLLIPNTAATLFYRMPDNTSGVDLGSLDIHAGEGTPPLWGFRSAAFGAPASHLGWAGASSTLLRLKSPGRSMLALIPVQASADAHARLGLSVGWNLPGVSVSSSSVLGIVVTNLGPWHCSEVRIGLPADFDALFSGFTVPGGGAGVERQGSVVKILGLPAGTSRTLNLTCVGKATPGEYSPSVEVLDSVPSLLGGRLTASATLRISDLPDLSVLSLSVEEAEDVVTARIPIRLSKASPSAVSCVVESVPVEATAPADFTPISTRVTFAPGMVETFADLKVTGDRLEELTETLRVQIKNPVGARVAVGEAIITILDNDGPSILPSTKAVDLVEGDHGTTSSSVLVRLASPPLRATRLYYQLQDGTAFGGSDFVKAFGFLEFPPGVVERSVGVKILGDIVPEADEQFVLVVAPVPGASSSMGVSSILIRNDDGSLVGIRLEIAIEEGGVIVSGEAVDHASYQLEVAAAPDGPWEPRGAPVSGLGGAIRFRQELKPLTTSFFRVVSLP